MDQDDFAKEGVRVAFKMSNLTAQAILKYLLRKLTRILEHYDKAAGHRTMQHMVYSGEKLNSVELTNPDLKRFQAFARKHGVQFSAVKNTVTNDYTVFFKANSRDQMDAALKAYAQQQLKMDLRPDHQQTRSASQYDRPSVQVALSRAKEKCAARSADAPQRSQRERTPRQKPPQVISL